MIHLISAHTGQFPAKTLRGPVWVLHTRDTHDVMTLIVTGLTAIPVTEWSAWARTIWCEDPIPTPDAIENGWMGSGPVHH